MIFHYQTLRILLKCATTARHTTLPGTNLETRFHHLVPTDPALACDLAQVIPDCAINTQMAVWDRGEDQPHRASSRVDGVLIRLAEATAVEALMVDPEAPRPVVEVVPWAQCEGAEEDTEDRHRLATGPTLDRDQCRHQRRRGTTMMLHPTQCASRLLDRLIWLCRHRMAVR